AATLPCNPNLSDSDVTSRGGGATRSDSAPTVHDGGAAASWGLGGQIWVLVRFCWPCHCLHGGGSRAETLLPSQVAVFSGGLKASKNEIKSGTLLGGVYFSIFIGVPLIYGTFVL
ncbi:hypothetical protein A2U01_0027803, partial [Trifolium medium]|nr:hypothetical protein [Trifolium medium]